MRMTGIQAYQNTALSTDSPWKLIDRLFEGAIARIDSGQLDKARRIVEEGLLGALDPAIPMSRSLADTYEAVLVHLEPGGDVATARKMLSTLREGWLGIRDKVPNAY